jgi:hypothetical protein
MTNSVAQNPFRFSTQMSLIELTGLSAKDLYELVTHLKTVPSSVLYYHTHTFLKQHQFLSPEPPNDFAYWVTNVLQEDRLGEQLAAIDTVRFSSLQTLRVALVETIEKYLAKGKTSRVAPEGEPFHFMKARSFVFATPHEARTLEEFAQALPKVSLYSLYHHIFEARLRLEKGSNDFSLWLETELGEKDLAKAIARLDPYTQTLDSLRNKIVTLVRSRQNKPSIIPQEVSHATR